MTVFSPDKPSGHSRLLYDNPIIYHVITDRFARGAEGTHAPFDSGTTSTSAIGEFHGGNFSGIIIKLREGWFCQLGINVLLISAPYQQILGWIPGAGAEFKHYAYHGYYVLDYTVVDARFGSECEFSELVQIAHKLGIRILLDIVLNHAGYADPCTLEDSGLPVVKPGWQGATPASFHEFMDYDHPGFQQWWGRDWVRAPIPGYDPGGNDDLTMVVANLPDFKTESAATVALPGFLARRPLSRVKPDANSSVRDYLIRWLTDWVRQFGIDGFRCDSAKHVELDAWFELKQASLAALTEWRSKRSQKNGNALPFWMMGEVFDHGPEASHYLDFGFDSLLNFKLQYDLNARRPLDAIFSEYAEALGSQAAFNMVSYISSHDTYLFPRSRIREASTALMLAPGGVLILYGDESGRLPGPYFPSDPAQSTRSNMNWESVDEALLEHWQHIGRFRARHVAIARGVHTCISQAPYAFSRVDTESGDRIIALPSATGPVSISVGDIFEDGQWVRDAYGGWRGQVSGQKVSLCASGTVLLELETDG